MGVLVGREAPDFTAAAVLGDGSIVDNFNFSKTIKNRYAVLFFYPLDFTFVCPSELIAFDHRLDEFLFDPFLSGGRYHTQKAGRSRGQVQGGGIKQLELQLAAVLQIPAHLQQALRCHLNPRVQRFRIRAFDLVAKALLQLLQKILKTFHRVLSVFTAAEAGDFYTDSAGCSAVSVGAAGPPSSTACWRVTARTQSRSPRFHT